MGQTRSKMQCPLCGYVKHKFEDFQTLSLPIPTLYEFYISIKNVGRLPVDSLGKIFEYGTVVSKFSPFVIFIFF